MATEKFIAFAMPEDLHALAKQQAAKERMTLKELVIQAVREKVQKGGKK